MKRKTQYKELRQLFGEPVAYLAQITDIANLELSAELMDSVRDGADTLLMMRGDVRLQQQYIEALPFTIRLVFCMWLLDTDLASKIIRSVYTKA